MYKFKVGDNVLTKSDNKIGIIISRYEFKNTFYRVRLDDAVLFLNDNEIISLVENRENNFLKLLNGEFQV